MSVIIRLQNLPWSASALDIRQYFHGLAIPEGGVHIVGGEHGDAFIAFSTDEDARQAMLMDGGKIKEATVRLHLSSRSQMQKVIEDARQASLQPFMQIPVPVPVSVPQTLPQVQSHPGFISQMGQLNQLSSQLTNHMLLAAQQNPLAHSLIGAGQVGAPGGRAIPGVVPAPSVTTASVGDPTGAASAATPLTEFGAAARYHYGNMVMLGGALGAAGAALPVAGSTGTVRPQGAQQTRGSPSNEAEDADDRKDDDLARRRDRRSDRSRSRDRRDRDRYRDRRRRSRERDRSRDRGRRRRSRSSSRSRDRNPRRSSREKRDHDRSVNDGPEGESVPLVSGASAGLLKVPERGPDGTWSSQPSQLVNPNLMRAQREQGEGPAVAVSGPGGPGGLGSLVGAGRLGGVAGPGASGGPFGALGGQHGPGSLLRGPNPAQGGLVMRNGPGGFGGDPGDQDGGRPDALWMQRGKDLAPDMDRRHEGLGDGRRGFGGPGQGPAGGFSRVGPMFNRQGPRLDRPEGDGLGRPGMGMQGPNFMDRPVLTRPGPILGDRPGPGPMMDRMRPNGFDRNAPPLLNRPGGGMMDRLRPNMMVPGGQGTRFSDVDNGDEDYEEQDMDMEDPFADPEEESFEEERNEENNRNQQPFVGMRNDAGRDDRDGFRDERYDRSRRTDRDRDRDRDRGRDRDRRSRDRFRDRPRSVDRDRERKDDSKYDRHGKDEFGRDIRPDERYSRDRYKDRPPEPNSCIEIRNMAKHTGYGDIRRFFHPLVIPGPGLKLINDHEGRRTGVAYIRFCSRRDRESALTYSKQTLKGESVLIAGLSDEIFENAFDSYVPAKLEVTDKAPNKAAEEPKKDPNASQVESSNQYTCVVVQNAPNYARDDDIRRLFKFCSLDVFWELAKEGRRQKVAYVKLKKTEDCKRFLLANSKFQIGSVEVKVVGCSEKEYEDAKKRQNGPSEKSVQKAEEPRALEQKPETKTEKPSQAQQNLSGAQDDSPEVICLPDDEKVDEKQRLLKPLNTECVVMRNLPSNAIDRDIVDFFSDVGLVPLKIHIMLDQMNKPTGEAYCEFQNGLETARAVAKNCSHMGKLIVSVLPISRPEMNDALNILTEPVISGLAIVAAPPGPGQMRPFHGAPGMFNPGFMGARGPGGALGGSGPGSGSGPGPMMRGPGGPHPSLLGAGPGMTPPGAMRASLQLQDMSAEGFGRPGCVVACENIPFRAEIDDILQYFGGFNLSHDSVIRRYNERGLPTGDARIAFASPADAQRAIRDLRFQKLQGRTIFMKLI